MKFFLWVLGMCEWCSSVVYFRGWLRCVKWKAWSWTWIGKIMAVVCKSVKLVSRRI